MKSGYQSTAKGQPDSKRRQPLHNKRATTQQEGATTPQERATTQHQGTTNQQQRATTQKQGASSQQEGGKQTMKKGQAANKKGQAVPSKAEWQPRWVPAPYLSTRRWHLLRAHSCGLPRAAPGTGSGWPRCQRSGRCPARWGPAHGRSVLHPQPPGLPHSPAACRPRGHPSGPSGRRRQCPRCHRGAPPAGLCRGRGRSPAGRWQGLTLAMVESKGKMSGGRRGLAAAGSSWQQALRLLGQGLPLPL